MTKRQLWKRRGQHISAFLVQPFQYYPPFWKNYQKLLNLNASPPNGRCLFCQLVRSVSSLLVWPVRFSGQGLGMLMVTKCPGAVYFFGCFPSLQLKIFHLKCIEENWKRRIWKINWNLSKGFKVVPIQNSTLEHLQILTWVLSPDSVLQVGSLERRKISDTNTSPCVASMHKLRLIRDSKRRSSRFEIRIKYFLLLKTCSRPAQDPPDEHLY